MTDLPIDLTRLDAFPRFASGTHSPDDGAACIMEAISYIAREPWSDHPQCVCPVLASLCRTWNDGLPDGERDAILRPLVPRLIGTRGSDALAHRRALMAADWLVREHTPAWLRLAGLTAQADALAALPEITDIAQVPGIRGTLNAVQKDAAAAWEATTEAAGNAAWNAAGAAAGNAAWNATTEAAGNAAWNAAGAAAGNAAWNAAGAAAGNAAWNATTEAAGNAAWNAAGAAAWTAAWGAAWEATTEAAWGAAGAALKPTRDALQQSALRLVERMIDAREGSHD